MYYWLGQGFGIISTIIDISIPLFKKKRQMLVANIFVNVFLALNLVFLNQIGSGIFLFAVAIVQAIVNLIHTIRERAPKKWEYILFFCMYVGLGLFGLFTASDFVPAINAKNLLEVLPILAAVYSMLFVGTRDEKKSRIYLLFCYALWAIYHAIILSTSFFGSFCGVLTCVIAIIRDHKKKTIC